MYRPLVDTNPWKNEYSITETCRRLDDDLDEYKILLKGPLEGISLRKFPPIPLITSKKFCKFIPTTK